MITAATDQRIDEVASAWIWAPARPVGHLCELIGWARGREVERLRLTIGDHAVPVRAGDCPDAPDGARGWVATVRRPLPLGRYVVELRDDVGWALAACAVEVGRGSEEPPLVIGEFEQPCPDRVVEGDVLYVCGWVLLDGRAASAVEVVVEGAGTTRARTRLPRVDVPPEFPGFGDAAISGFDARVPIDVAPGEQRTVSLWLRYRGAGGEVVSSRRTVLMRNAPGEVKRDVRSDAELADELAAETEAAMRRVTVTTDPRKVLVFTHSLGVGGGQLWLRQLLAGLVGDWRVSLVSELDGPLRADCAALGIAVHVTTPYRHRDVVEYEGHVAELARFARCSGAGVALINTLGGFPAADAAQRAGMPTAWVIHESFSLPDFAYQNWGPCQPPPVVRRCWTRALARADRLLFVADATREMFLPYSTPPRCQMVRYGTPMYEFGGRIPTATRAIARESLGFDDEDFVLVTIGISEPRKGHGPLLSAMRTLRRRYPRLRLCVVGWHASPYGRSLRETVERDGLADIVDLVEVRRDPTPWLFAADAFVNASDIESLPRSILEAVACGVPVVATDVFGAREIIIDGRGGWLYEPNDTDALTAALARMLDTPVGRRREMAAAAYRRVAGWLDPAGYVRDYSKILAELADG